MKFKVLTLFPEMILDALNTSIIGRASQNKFIELSAVNIRDYTQDKHGKVDDYTYGGGAGMLIQAQPVYDAWKAVAGDGHPRTVYVTPQGAPFTQQYAQDLAQESEIVFLCGHYEGIDARVLEEVVTDYISIGDYVLTGGELPAMVMIDAISRLVPGVLHNEESARTESFHRNLLEYPQYSRPELWHDKKVPDVLLCGDHKKIENWRLEKSIQLTKERRPDLYALYVEQENLIKQLSKNKRKNIHIIENIRRGRGEILINKPGQLLVYDRACRLGMFSAASEEHAIELTQSVPEFLKKEMIIAVTDHESLHPFMEAMFSLKMQCECKQVCYTQKNTLPVRHKDIRILTEEQLDYVAENYHMQAAEYVSERIQAKAMYGAFVDDRIVGFIGCHCEGSMGMLFVEPKYRNQGIAQALEAYCINRQLENGYVPYGHVMTENEVSFHLQEKIGLYCSNETLWWWE